MDLQKYVTSKLDRFRQQVANNVVKQATSAFNATPIGQGIQGFQALQRQAPQIQSFVQPKIQQIQPQLQQFKTNALNTNLTPLAGPLGAKLPRFTVGDLNPANEKSPLLGGIRKFQREGTEQTIAKHEGMPYQSNYQLGDINRFFDMSNRYQQTPQGLAEIVTSVGGGKTSTKAVTELNEKFAKDVYKQVNANKTQILDSLKRFSAFFESNTNKMPSIEQSEFVRKDLELAFKQIYGAGKKVRVPQNIYDLASAVRRGFKEFRVPEIYGIDEGGIGLGTGIIKRRKVADVVNAGLYDTAISSEGVKIKGKLKVNNFPTETEMLNRAEVNAGNPDLYKQRQDKWSGGNPRPLPWEAKAPKTTQDVQMPTKTPMQQPELYKPVQSSRTDALQETLDQKITQKGQDLKFPTDVATQVRAEAHTVSENGKKGFGALHPEVQDVFQKWVNERHATKVEGFLKNKEFADLDKQGMEGFFKVQAGDTTGKLGEVKKYFDDKFNTLKAAGIDFNYQKDYLPQQWDNSDAEVAQVFGRSLGTRPGFTLEKMIKDYKTGIAAGLKPKFKTVGQLVGYYEERANKALADKKMFEYLGKDGMFQPASKAPQGWETIDADRFPKVKINVDGTDYVGTYKAPPNLAKAINNYLRDPQFGGLEAIANYVSRVKNITLNFGIPGTAINAHGINTLARHTLFGTGSNPVFRFITGAKYMVNAGSAEKYLDKNMVNAPAAVKNGLTMSAEDYAGLGSQAENLAGQFSKNWENAFGAPLFNKMIPALKLSSYEKLVKDGMNPKDAAKLANNVYGGINWEQMGRNRDFQNLLRSVILAPDWGETTLKLGGNFAKAINPLHKSQVANRYRAMMATFLASYVALNVANKATSGHYAYENEAGHTFQIEAGYTASGEKRYITPYGTAMDMVRIPYDIAKGLKEGDVSVLWRTIRNRMSIPAGVALGAMTDTDYRGKAIGYRGTDKWGNEMPLKDRAVNIGSEALSLIGMPNIVRQVAMSATGQQGWEEGLAQGFEMPVRYSNSGNSNVSKQLAPMTGFKGKELYEFNQSLKGQNKFTDKQMATVNEAGTVQGVNQVLQTRAGNKLEDQTREQVRSSGGTGQANGKLFYVKDGEVKSVQLDRTIEMPKLTGNYELDKKLMSKYNSTLTAKKNDITALYELGKISAEEAEKQLKTLTSQKLKAGGGRKYKVKKITVGKIKVPKLKAYKAKKIKTSKVGVKFAKVKYPKVKLLKAKKTA